MKNKKGFVFLESVIVLVVVALALTGFLATYTLLSNNTKRREYYDKTSDKYLLYAISTMGTDGKNNYSTCTTGNSISFDRDNLDPNECIIKNFYNNETVAENMFDTAGLKYLYYVENISTALKDNPASKYDNGAIEYMKTLPVNKYNYLIGVFRRSDDYYYASINLDKTINAYANNVNNLKRMSLFVNGVEQDLNALSTLQNITVPSTTTNISVSFDVANPESIVSITGATLVTVDADQGKYKTSNVTFGSNSVVEVVITLTPKNHDNSKINTYKVVVTKKEPEPTPTPDPTPNPNPIGG